MMFGIRILTDELGERPHQEIARILREQADRVEKWKETPKVSIGLVRNGDKVIGGIGFEEGNDFE